MLKKLITPSILVLFLLSPFFPGTTGRGCADEAKRAERVTSQVIEALNLEEEQLEKFLEIIASYQESARKILKDNSAAPEKAKQELAELTSGMLSSLREILTSEQWETYRRIRRRVREEFTDTERGN